MNIQKVAEQLAKETPLNDIHNAAVEFIERLYQAKGVQKIYSDRIVATILSDAW